MVVLGPALAVALLSELLSLWSPLWRAGFAGPTLGFAIFFMGRIGAFIAGAWVARFAWRLLRLRSWREALDGLWSRPYRRDLLWILVAYAILGTSHSWTKVLIPAFGGALWDTRLAAADSWLCLGINPNIFLSSIFGDGPPWAARALDAYYLIYSWITLSVAAWFATDRDDRNRVPMVAGFAAVWSVGMWGYLLMPAVGPALAFQGLWEEGVAVFPGNAALQAVLLENYGKVLELLRDPASNPLINPAFGVAAMPSLHVGAHAYLFFWARAVRSALSGPLLACTILTFIGSVATGWHYLVDALAGLLLGFLVARFALWLRQRFAERSRGAGVEGEGREPSAARLDPVRGVLE